MPNMQPIPEIKLASDNGNGKKEIRIPLMQEQGVSGLKEYGGFVNEAYNARLFYPQVASEYARLRRSCPPIVMVVRQFTAWARNIKPVVNLPDEPTDDDKRYKDFRDSDYENMEGGFGQYIEQNVGRVPFDGWYAWNICLSRRDPLWIPPAYIDGQKKVWADDWRSEADDGLIGIRRLAPRDNSSFFKWDFDGAQRVIAMIQRDPQTGYETRLTKDQMLHHTFGDPSNPEGVATLEAAYRLERLQYGYQVVSGIAAEHAAGYLKFTKTEKGEWGNADLDLMGRAAKYMLTGQEGNYAILPYGVDAELIETNLAAFPALTEAIKNFDILMLSLWGMQWMALNTMTKGGAKAAQVDATDSGISGFNAMLDGFSSQWNDQVEKKIYEVNKSSFPNLTKRPKVTFSHLENVVPVSEIAQFFNAMEPGLKFPLGEDDFKAIRRLTGFLPLNNPKPEDVIQPDGTKAGDNPQPQPPITGQPLDPNQPLTPEQQAQVAGTRDKIKAALSYMSRRVFPSVELGKK